MAKEKVLLEWQSPLAAAVEGATDNGDEERAARAGVCDLSSLPREGAKGECAAAAPPINAAAIFGESLCCRLGGDEILALSQNGAAAELGECIPSPRTRIPRRDSHCQVGLCGAKAAEVLSELCAVPLPPPLGVLQTRVAELSAIVVAVSSAKTDAAAFYLLADRGYAAHLWDALLAAARFRNGGMIGWRQWQKSVLGRD